MNRMATDNQGATAVAVDLAGRRPASENPLRIGAAGLSLAAQLEHELVERSAPIADRLESLFAVAAERVHEPPQGMTTYLERLCSRVEGDGDRRQTDRVTLLATALAIPITAADEPCGEPFKGVVRDASKGGMSLLHTRAVVGERLAVRWQTLASAGRTVTVVMQIDRCRPLGPFYEVAGKFLNRED